MRKEFSDLRCLTARHIKLFFKDKQTFFMSLITPMILVALFILFLRSVYVNSLVSALPEGVSLPDRVVNGFIAGWLISSVLGACSVTLAFCSQTIMVNDKVTRRMEDFRIAPVSPVILSVSYFLPRSFPRCWSVWRAWRSGLSILPRAAGILRRGTCWEFWEISSFLRRSGHCSR